MFPFLGPSREALNTTNKATGFIVLVVCLKFCLLCGRFIKSEIWPVVGFGPHIGSTGVFGWNLNTLDPINWSLKEVFSAAN